MATIRDSNIELMRLICMMMILIHHMICHGIYSVDSIFFNGGQQNTSIIYATLFNSLCYIGVNCFILISGYYGIKFKIKGILNLYFICFFYSIIQHLIACYYDGNPFSWDMLKDSVFIFSHNDYWWFISCYIILYFLSPILNRALDSFSKKEYRIILLLLTIVNLYFGYWWGGKYNFDGYSVSQFVFIYSIGKYVGRFITLQQIETRRITALVMYLLSAIIYWLLSIASRHIGIPHWRSMPYNNPLLIIGALSFFMYMLSFHFKNRCINWLATSSLSIYLLQDFRSMKFISSYYDTNSGVLYLTLFLLLFSISFGIISISIDQIRKCLYKPIVYLYDFYIEGKGKKLFMR